MFQRKREQLEKRAEQQTDTTEIDLEIFYDWDKIMEERSSKLKKERRKVRGGREFRELRHRARAGN